VREFRYYSLYWKVEVVKKIESIIVLEREKRRARGGYGDEVLEADIWPYPWMGLNGQNLSHKDPLRNLACIVGEDPLRNLACLVGVQSESGMFGYLNDMLGQIQKSKNNVLRG
jgi:hypothetical protein